MSRYFKLEEFLVSDKAKEKGIQNNPSWEVVEHLSELSNVLDIIRKDIGFAITVSSGFRCPDLNTAVKGASTSGHLTGWAADLIPTKGTVEDFASKVKTILDKNDIKYDELIFEQNSKGSKWLHFSLYSYNGEQRFKNFSLNVK